MGSVQISWHIATIFSPNYIIFASSSNTTTVWFHFGTGVGSPEVMGKRCFSICNKLSLIAWYLAHINWILAASFVEIPGGALSKYPVNRLFCWNSSKHWCDRVNAYNHWLSKIVIVGPSLPNMNVCSDKGGCQPNQEHTTATPLLLLVKLNNAWWVLCVLPLG